MTFYQNNSAHIWLLFNNRPAGREVVNAWTVCITLYVLTCADCSPNSRMSKNAPVRMLCEHCKARMGASAMMNTYVEDRPIIGPQTENVNTHSKMEIVLMC